MAPSSILFARSVAFVVDIVPLNENCYTAVSELVNIKSCLQIKFKLSLTDDIASSSATLLRDARLNTFGKANIIS